MRFTVTRRVKGLHTGKICSQRMHAVCACRPALWNACFTRQRNEIRPAMSGLRKYRTGKRSPSATGRLSRCPDGRTLAQPCLHALQPSALAESCKLEAAVPVLSAPYP